MFGVNAYVVFTIDRLVQNIVRQVRGVAMGGDCYDQCAFPMSVLLQAFVNSIVHPDVEVHVYVVVAEWLRR